MKQTFVQIGKYFFLILSILLISSNIQVFSGGISTAEMNKLTTQRSALAKQVESLFEYKRQLCESTDPIKGTNLEAYVKGYNEYLKDLESKYYLYIQKENEFYSKLIPTRHVGEITNKYTGEVNEINNMISLVRSRDEAVFFKLEKIMEDVEYFSNRKLQGLDSLHSYKNLLSDAKLQEWNNCITYFVERFNGGMKVKTALEIKTANKEILAQLSVLFSKSVKPEDIIEEAFRKGMLPNEKVGIKLIFDTMKEEIPIRIIAQNIIDYLNEFGIKAKNIENSTVDGLIKELKSLTPGKRANRVGEIIGLDAGSKSFISDVKKLEEGFAKERIIKNITKGVWVLVGLGVIATTAYIADVTADNHFNSAYTTSNRELANISRKIKDGTANIKEKFAFFRNPLTKHFVETDSAYTLSFVQLYSDICTADELLQKVQKSQGQQAKDEVENSMLKSLDYQEGRTDFGVGTL